MNPIWFAGILIGFLCLALGLVLYPLRRQKKLIAALLPLFILLVTSAYWHWGAWFDWREHLQVQERQREVKAILTTVDGKEKLLNKLKAQLNERPDSAKGWYLLGRLQSSENNWQEAHDAFKRAYRLQPDEEQIVINYAQSLWQLNQGQFNKAIYDLFADVLKKNPKQPDALAMLAMNAFMSHDYQQAIDYWQRLLKIVPPASDDAKAIRKAIAKAQAEFVH